MSTPVVGWDVGGVNLKAALVQDGHVQRVLSVPFEIQHRANELVSALRATALELGVSPATPHAVTMTGELSQLFRTKRDGVRAIVSAMSEAFLTSGCPVRYFTTNGSFLDAEAAIAAHIRVSAANWRAAAGIVALSWPNCLFVDIGSTTTDIIPILHGKVVADGLTDPDRLATGELIYLGALRTPIEAVVHSVPTPRGQSGVSAEAFAILGDVYLCLGELSPLEYTTPTPDGRPATVEYAAERLARVICTDSELLAPAHLFALARYIAIRHTERTADALRRVHHRHPTTTLAVTAGLGEWIATRAAAQAGIATISLSESFGNDASKCLPAAAVAILLEQSLATATFL